LAKFDPVTYASECDRFNHFSICTEKYWYFDMQVCLDGLGSLSVKHPIMAAAAISCLRDFLGKAAPLPISTKYFF
jgi:hypothetical protein